MGGARLTYVGPQSVELAETSLDNQISSYKLYRTAEAAGAEVLVLREQGLSAVGGWGAPFSGAAAASGPRASTNKAPKGVPRSPVAEAKQAGRPEGGNS